MIRYDYINEIYEFIYELICYVLGFSQVKFKFIVEIYKDD